MRNKVFLIKGAAKIASQVTVAPYERINADYVALITALRHPEFLPAEYSGFEADPTSIYTCIGKVMEHWRQNHHDHLVASEYASMMVDRGPDVRIVEGFSLQAEWFYHTVRSLHRHLGQTVVDCEVIYSRENLWLRIDTIDHRIEDAIERLKSSHTLG